VSSVSSVAYASSLSAARGLLAIASDANNSTTTANSTTTTLHSSSLVSASLTSLSVHSASASSTAVASTTSKGIAGINDIPAALTVGVMGLIVGALL
ncbi:hypothetical protein WICPIJ_008361, partial [Wickerhamomyces pijperi]